MCIFMVREIQNEYNCFYTQLYKLQTSYALVSWICTTGKMNKMYRLLLNAYIWDFVFAKICLCTKNNFLVLKKPMLSDSKNLGIQF